MFVYISIILRIKYKKGKELKYMEIKNIIPKKSQYFLVFILILLIAVSSVITIFDKIKNSKQEEQSKVSSCNTVIIKLEGDVVTYKSDLPDVWTDEAVSSDILSALDNAEKDSEIKAVVLQIDSTGGSPSAGKEIADALKRMTKPTVALIKDSGDSSAYYAATGASHIIASSLSDVGSIGVIISYMDETEKDKKEGLSPIVLSSGKYKNSGSIHSPLSEDEKNMFMKDILKMHEMFVDEVSVNRHLERNIVAKLADGSTMLGGDALKAGLIDELGDMFSVKNYLAEQIGEDVVFCE
jgi:protease-4